MPHPFRDLHVPGRPFILANAWDKGTARLFAALGAQALATSSGAHAFSLGRSDLGTITRDEALAHAQTIVSATSLPVSGDFENGFGDAPDALEETVRLSAEIGLAGISIEDISFPGVQHYTFDLAVERIKAASAAARALPNDFVLVARADGFMHGLYDLDESIRRIQAFEKAGADCVYVPYLQDLETVTRVCRSVSIPVNVGISTVEHLSLKDFATAGAARISLGMAMATAAYTALHQLSSNMFGEGDFAQLGESLPYEILDDCIAKGRAM
ncbi:isocitrate lyase/phosphoenolpyruvate mutase family protein [Sulfitobacter sp. S190]|uniref:isocitrate lyase/PEP mutase family protein n=1 Tax=Sulfitobacter sp. S190 TaxID=2867022 RepID=UPI0021A8DE67|nr:isocitrate lyase/phosphoenolpyruvate mutase family protein [Sulfitobacter sp. S190]UWR21816.1 isocitrate lyase/phosphoenolpyruvate mutase family protein [Sulfitobacter sp. S190]